MKMALLIVVDKLDSLEETVKVLFPPDVQAKFHSICHKKQLEGITDPAQVSRRIEMGQET